jgi:uncharacterized protein YecT (DUF1311 family)
MRWAAVVAALALLAAAAPTHAQNKPNAKDFAKIQDCVKTKTGANWAWERCIGTISDVCAKDEGSMTPSQVIACYDRERAVGDDILNESFRRLRAALRPNK